jgi:RHS repeat-associated protein
VVGLPKLLQDGTNTYVYGIGLISTTDGSGNQTYPQHDGLGSTVALANGSGAITGTYSYDVFGAVRSHTGGSTEFGFTGEQNDPNGLEYLRARYYDPATGRFLGRDPLGQGYGYAGGNPANRVDPTGLYWIACPGDDQCIWSEDVGLPVDPPVDCSEPGGYGYCIWADGEIFIAGGPVNVFQGTCNFGDGTPCDLITVAALVWGAEASNGRGPQFIPGGTCLAPDLNCNSTVVFVEARLYCSVARQYGDSTDKNCDPVIAIACSLLICKLQDTSEDIEPDPPTPKLPKFKPAGCKFFAPQPDEENPC